MRKSVLADPYRWFERLHNSGPVHYSPTRQVWVLSSFEQVRDALRAPEALSSSEGISMARTSSLNMLVAKDPPEHTRLRKAVAGAFTKRGLAGFVPELEEIAAHRVDRACAGGRLDIVPALADPFPVDVVAALLGVPESALPDFRTWSESIVFDFSVPKLSRRSVLAAQAAARLLNYFHEVADRRDRDRPANGMMGRLLDCIGDEYSESDFAWFCFLLVVAGNETTTALIASALAVLAHDPGLYGRVRADPSLIEQVLDESLRCFPPFLGTYRTAVTDYPVGPVTVPGGSRVLISLGAANRDPARYPDPGRFELDRPVVDRIAFGTGIHRCIGARLAMHEATAVLRRLVERVRELRPAGTPVWNTSPATRRLTTLPLTVRLD